MSAGLVFMEGGYHLLLELFEWSHTRIVFEVVLLLKKSKPEEIRGVKHYNLSVYLGRVLPLCWQRFCFLSLELVP